MSRTEAGRTRMFQTHGPAMLNDRSPIAVQLQLCLHPVLFLIYQLFPKNSSGHVSDVTLNTSCTEEGE